MKTLRCSALWGWALVTIACSEPAAAPAAIDEQPEAEEAGAPIVECIEVERRALGGDVVLQGEIQPLLQVDLFAKVAAYVQQIPVDRGSKVERGDTLVRLRAPELHAERAQAEASLQGERSTLDRLEAASRTKGAVAKHEVDLARARVAQADAQVKRWRAMEAYLRIEAPFTGVVTERLVHPGALVEPGSKTPLLRLESIDTVRLVVAVPETWIGSVALNREVPFGVIAWPARTFTGVVVRVADRVDPTTRTMAVELDVANADHALKPGMFAEVQWPIGRPVDSIFVPRTAIVGSTLDTYVVVVRDGLARHVHIERGTTVGQDCEVFGALEQGDLVVRRANEDLADGTALEVRRVDAEP